MNAATRRRLGGAALALLVGLLLLALGKFALSAHNALRYPFELDYGEGIVWQQMVDIVAGRGYAPLGVFPAIVYHYPPVYHLVTAALAAATGLDGLTAGRLLSVLATIGCMIVIARLALMTMPARIARTPALVAASLGGASFIGSPTVLGWSSLMRVDLLACLLTLAGLLLAVQGLARPWRLHAAALVFALAVYTKQTAILGPAAAFVTLWIARSRAGWAFAAACLALGLAALVALEIATHGEFLRHVVLYNVNRFDGGRWHMLVRTLASQAISLPLAAIAAISAWTHLRPLDWRTLRSRIETDPRDAALLIALVYLIGRVVLMLMILKSGASDNYLIDLFSIAAVFVALSIVPVAAAILQRTAWPRAFVVCLVLIGLPVQAYRLRVAHPETADVAERADLAGLVDRIARAPRPVVSDDMILLRQAGKPVLYEPAIAAELAHAGRYDQAAFIAKIRRGDFGFFITHGIRGEHWFDERYNTPVAAAIGAAYPRLERHGDLVLHLPR